MDADADERAALTQLQREVAALRRENAVLKALRLMMMVATVLGRRGAVHWRVRSVRTVRTRAWRS